MKKKTLNYILIFVLMVLFPASYVAAEEGNLQDFLQAIQAGSDQVQSFSSDFTQEKTLSMFAKPVIFQGRLSIVRPDRLRWAFTSPVPSVLIFKGDQGIRCNDKAPARKFQLSSDPVMKMVAKQLWLWLGGDYERLNSLYKLEKSGSATLKITPEDQGTADFIDSVSIVFDEKSLQPKQVEIMEPGGDLTRLTFHSSTINVELAEKLFTKCNINE